MKKILNILKENKGLSLVELIATVAIMSIVSAGIAVAVISATRNYSRGNSEVDLQQEVQNITNILNNLVLDSIRVENPDGNHNVLNITSSDGSTYVISCDGASLNYTKTGYEPEVLSQYVTSFSADADSFLADRTVSFDLRFRTAKDEREMKTSFTSTSRNADTYDTAIKKLYSCSIVVDPIAVVEPNQTVTIPFDILVSGDAENTIIPENSAIATDSSLSVTESFSAAEKSIVFKAGTTEAHDSVTVKITVRGQKDGVEVYNVSENVVIKIRRVQKADPDIDYKPFDIYGAPLDLNNETGAGAIHEITVDRLDVQNAERYFAVPSDVDYVTPYKVKYIVSTVKYDLSNITFSKNGAVQSGTSVTFQDEKGNETAGLVYDAEKEDVIDLKLAAKMDIGAKITVRAIACHAYNGVNANGLEDITNFTADNKSGIAYSYVYDKYEIIASLFPSGSGYKRGVEPPASPAHGAIETRDQKINDFVDNSFLDYLKSTNETYALFFSNYNDHVLPLKALLKEKCGYQAFYTIGAKKLPGDPYGNSYLEQTIDGTKWYFSQYKVMTDSEDGGAYHFDKIGDADTTSPVQGAGGAMRLEPDQDYVLEFVAVLYAKDDIVYEIPGASSLVIPKGTILWPRYDKLMDLGFGGGTGGANMTFASFADE
ncbi:MAG: type II secretion system GspH family protein, partial [Lachnospiraceae bacterium]|nr:type II secretion system GspH family protein [Lachnospiraceae bacterium]